MIYIITEPPNMHWFDVRDEYFNAYRAPGGRMFKYKETKSRSLYKKPYYTEDDRQYMDEELQKFMFKTNDDMRHCKRILQGMKCSLVQVSVFFIFLQ